MKSPRNQIPMTLNVPSEWKRAIEAQAEKNGMGVNEYCRIILIDAAQKGVDVKQKITLVSSEE